MIKGRLCRGCHTWLPLGGDCYKCLTGAGPITDGVSQMYSYTEKTKGKAFILVHEKGTNEPTYINLDKLIYCQRNVIVNNYETFFCCENLEQLAELIAEARNEIQIKTSGY